MSKSSLSKILYWDENVESFGVHISKIKAYTEFVRVGNALDPILMKNCPTWSEFEELDITKVGDQDLIDQYKSNKKLCAILCWVKERTMDWHSWKRPKMRIIPIN